jgi:hypothetical protein
MWDHYEYIYISVSSILFMVNPDPWDDIEVDNQTLRVVTIVDPDVTPADKTVCHRHAKDLEMMYAHVRAHDGVVYHTHGEKRLHYCPECIQELCEGANLPMLPPVETVALYVAAKQFKPDSQEAAEKRWWEPCESEAHHEKYIDVTP